MKAWLSTGSSGSWFASWAVRSFRKASFPSSFCAALVLLALLAVALLLLETGYSSMGCSLSCLHVNAARSRGGRPGLRGPRRGSGGRVATGFGCFVPCFPALLERAFASAAGALLRSRIARHAVARCGLDGCELQPLARERAGELAGPGLHGVRRVAFDPEVEGAVAHAQVELERAHRAGVDLEVRGVAEHGALDVRSGRRGKSRAWPVGGGEGRAGGRGAGRRPGRCGAGGGGGGG